MSHQDIPRKLVLAMNTQMKIFYRPKKLPAITQNQDKLTFAVQQHEGASVIKVNNPTPYHVSFTGMAVKHGATSINAEQQMDMMVSPFSKKRYRLLQQPANITDPATIEYYFIDDFGAVLKGRAPVQ
ncbi:MAG: putative fimbrial chaperone YadV [Candidatus Erwinia impunctatus]